MGVHRDLRTPVEIFDDMLADDYPLDDIARRLGWTTGQVRNHYLKVCARLGERPDEE
jgi:hypothetical protein